MKKLVLFLQSDGLSEGLSLKSRVNAIIYQQVASDSDSSTSNEQKELFLDLSIEDLIETFSVDIQEANIRTTLVIPGENILHCQLKVPAKQFRQVQKALPYLVEDQLASDPDDCFIAIGEHVGELLPCAIIHKDKIAHYHSFLLEKALNAEKIVCDDSLLANEFASLHIFEKRILMSNGQGLTFAFDLALLDIYLDKLKPLESKVDSKLKSESNILEDDDLEQITSADIDSRDLSQESLELVFYQDEQKNIETIKNQVLTTIDNYKKNKGLDFEIKVLDKNKNDYFLSSAAAANDRAKQEKIINFLQGEYKVKRIGSLFKFDVNWRPIAYLLLAFVVLYIVGVFVETKKYQNAADEADLKTKEVFKEIFPKARKFDGMERQVKSLLKGSVAPSDNQFLKLIYSFSDTMQSINAVKADSLKPTQIQYEQANAELKIEMIAVDFDTLNSLKEKAEASGMVLEISSTSTEKFGVKGRLKVKLAP